MIKEFESKKDSLVSFGTFWRSKYLSPTTSLLTKGYLENLSRMTIEKHAPDPKSQGEAMSRDDWPMWKKAEDEEYQNLDEHDSWEIVEKPSPGVKPIKTVFKYKTKWNADNTIDKRKACLCAQGF